MKDSFADRLRKMRSKRYDEWWFVVFGGPVGSILAALLAPFGFVTPNLVTLFSFLCKVVGAVLLIDQSHDMEACLLLQLGVALDITDGGLARYRQKTSLVGDILDKVADVLGLVALCLCFGLRLFQQTENHWLLLASIFISYAFLFRSYLYWVVRNKTDLAPPQPQPLPNDRRERIKYYLWSFWWILEAGESDLHFWICLSVLLKQEKLTVIVLSAVMLINLLRMIMKRVLFVRAFEQEA